MTPLFLIVAALVITVALIWWLVIETEGVYLGRRVVIWLYDVYANRYDGIKHFLPEYESWLLAQPILGILAPQENPLVLDVATGTGRLPLALLNEPNFQGRIVAVDLSRQMLSKAAEKLQTEGNCVSLLWCPADQLPFEDNQFDVVTCLEALEFMPYPAEALREIVRVLRPGGLLLITNRIHTRWMPGKLWSSDQMIELLDSYGIEDIEIELWQVDYHKIWGMKAGDTFPVGARPLGEILRCPQCPDQLMIEQSDVWRCDSCDSTAKIGADGVIELNPLYSTEHTKPHNRHQ
jgi:ubiquinone/menaquinone biosynthesis C-methylase UbiE